MLDQKPLMAHMLIRKPLMAHLIIIRYILCSKSTFDNYFFCSDITSLVRLDGSAHRLLDGVVVDCWVFLSPIGGCVAMAIVLIPSTSIHLPRHIAPDILSIQSKLLLWMKTTQHLIGVVVPTSLLSVASTGSPPAPVPTFQRSCPFLLCTITAQARGTCRPPSMWLNIFNQRPHMALPSINRPPRP